MRIVHSPPRRGLLAASAFWAAWRSKSFAAGLAVTIVMTQIVAVMSAAGVTTLLAIWHDPATMRAAADSGGIEEAYVLPFMAVIPAVIVGSVAAMVGMVSSWARFRKRRSASL